MQNKIRIPANLNLKQLIKDVLPQYDGDKSKIDELNMAFICHSIIGQWLRFKTDHWSNRFQKNYVPLDSRILRYYVPQYENCVRFLIYAAVIKCDRVKIEGIKCYGYTLTDKYIGTGFMYISVNGFLKGKIDNYLEKLKKEDEGWLNQLITKRKHLINCILNSKLTIEPAALWEARNIYKEDAYNIHAYFNNNNDPIKKQELLKEAAINRNVNEELIKLINDPNKGEKYYTIDKKGQRLHSPITRLPERLRKYLKYDGKKLKSIDISNSQPYFSILLFNKEIYKKTGKGKIRINKINSEIYNILKSTITLILRKSSETHASPAFIQFKNDVLSGNLYDRFVSIDKHAPNFKEERNIIKKDFLMTMYDVPRDKGKAKKFVETYPCVFELFNLIRNVKTGETKRRAIRQGRKNNLTLKGIRTVAKKTANGEFDKSLIKYPYNDEDIEVQPYKYIEIDTGYTLLAILLQLIESYLLLDIICRKIAKINPEIPLITIHDCIATTVEHVPFVKETIKNVLQEYVGYTPDLKEEDWAREIAKPISKIS